MVLAATLFAWAGIALDLFGFDGSETRSIGETIGTLEIAAVLLAIRARVLGIASSESEGFRAALEHRSGAQSLELGCAIGSGVGAFAACLPASMIIFAIYNLFPYIDLKTGVLLGLGIVAEASLAAAWTGLASKLAGRVPAIAIAVGAFVLARLNVPGPLRAILPAPLPLSTAGLLVHTICALMATLGLALTAAALAESGTESA